MKVGIMGGTFDPIHMGHLMAAEAVKDVYKLDEIWFMPSHIPPHKHAAGATGEQRLEMTNLATEEYGDYRVLDVEIVRGGVSYTIDTMEIIRRQHPDINLYFIIGADMVNYLSRWERIEDLTKLVTFIGVGRPGFELHLDDLPDFLQEHVLHADMPQVEISSTGIRRRLAKGRSVRFMVPKAVLDYITRSGLYAAEPR
ncbi:MULTISPECIES: nicotinate-nucleotide adenylyltransferase [unclassified Paenibacillus]|uniref:Probable nicotinate-nucleotide adenylyltransferase n=1 Tax=Paenibacillus provencensis TaxID=441151 RepID=A0ABW3PJ82_9BACL|nr:MULTISPECIES: nicotinate-nucleotide adenylyltransferase [unclassified Paenibacillus]MCM3126150.1 nicotinate-nucleotide adenylyltransferase [Paenibacillus sp. MER 78]SFS61793.1 nicotinate-nucleotide adenylyltransferase [Paenibacillus sp. 453mf]